MAFFKHGLVALATTAMLYSPQVQAKSLLEILFPSLAKKSDSISQTSKGKKQSLVKNIRCAFSGYTRTGAPAENVEFIEDDKVVCDPLSDQAAESSESGLLGKLILKSDAMAAKTKSVLEYHEKGTRLEQNLYFADVNVPTRTFSKGFFNRAGEVLVDNNGYRLIENFAIEYSSSLRLQASDKPGHYEIALLSDDGARLFIKQDSAWKEIVNNDGEHPTRMGCPFQTVYLDHSSEIPIKILYYQGPRYHISNVMMWKLHKKAQAWKEPARHSLCGYQGNGLFFNEKSSKDTVAMKLLKADGWATVASQNFKMPDNQSNPCAEEKLEITDFKVDETGSGYAILSWKTNLPSNSQVKIKATSSGEDYTSPLDENLVTDHVVRIEGLERGNSYQVQAISRDAKGNEAVSPPPPILVNQ